MKAVKRVLIVALVALMGGCAQDDLAHESLPFARVDARPQNLYPVTVGKKMGYIDRAGKIVIKPQWAYAAEFREGLAFVRSVDEASAEDSFTGSVIDEAGRVVIKRITLPPVGYGPYFSDGLIAFQDGKKVGYKDRTGRVAIPARFYCKIPADSCGCACENGAANPFRNGMAWVMEGHDVYLIDRKGKRLPDSAEPLAKSGLASFKKGKLWGFKDKSGKVVIQPRFTWVGEFSDGLCLAQTEPGESAEFIYLDKTGRQAFPGRFVYAERFSEGAARVNTLDGNQAIIDTSGKLYPIAENMEIRGPFVNGVARALTSAGSHAKTGRTVDQEVLINRKGEIVGRFAPGLDQQRIETDFDGFLVRVYSQDSKIPSGWANRSGKMVWIDKP